VIVLEKPLKSENLLEFEGQSAIWFVHFRFASGAKLSIDELSRLLFAVMEQVFTAACAPCSVTFGAGVISSCFFPHRHSVV